MERKNPNVERYAEKEVRRPDSKLTTFYYFAQDQAYFPYARELQLPRLLPAPAPEKAEQARG